MAALTDLTLPTASARADFTATYGGFQIGVGLFLLVCARQVGWLAVGLWAATAALAGLASVRGWAIIVSRGRVRGTIWFGLALELVGMALDGPERCRRLSMVNLPGVPEPIAAFLRGKHIAVAGVSGDAGGK